MVEFIISVAGVRVLVKCRFEETRQYMKDYIVKGDSYDIKASVSDEEIESMLCEIGSKNTALAERTGLYRPIAEAFPSDYEGFVFHGAAIKYKDKAYLFTAPSGTGKSTHITLWKKYLGSDNVTVINGDKPIVTVRTGEKPMIYGTPWSGKEHWQTNTGAELSAICLLCRGKENKIERISPKESVDFLLGQVYMPHSPLSLVRTMELIDKLLSEVPVYKLYCDISEEAVKCSLEGMSTLVYNDERKKDNEN